LVEYKEVQTHTKMELPNISDTKSASTPPETPPTKAETPPVTPTPAVSDKKEVTPPPPPPVTPAPVAQKAPTVVPVASKSILPGTILTKEDKAEIYSKRKDSLAQARFIKHFTFLLIMTSAMWFLWLQINISQSNSVLSLFGVNENIGQKIERVKKEKTKLKLENKKIEKNIEKIEQQLEAGTYTPFSIEIQKIRDEQIQWFDEIDSDGNVLYGFTDAVPRMRDYFNNGAYHDPNSILSGSHGDIQIENLQASRDGITFSVLGSQILGKVFFLNIEFVEMVNSFPFLKNGVLSQFSRQKNTEEEDMMSFSVRLDRQLPNEKDQADERFNEYTTWLNSITTE